MPSRRRPKAPPAAVVPAGASARSTDTRDPAELFARALRETEQRDKVARQKSASDRAEAARRAAVREAQATALADAERELARAIEAVRSAKAAGRTTVAADAAWKQAKARVIELQTGALPAWAPKPAPAEQPAGDEHADAAAGVEPA